MTQIYNTADDKFLGGVKLFFKGADIVENLEAGKLTTVVVTYEDAECNNVVQAEDALFHAFEQNQLILEARMGSVTIDVRPTTAVRMGEGSIIMLASVDVAGMMTGRFLDESQAPQIATVRFILFND